MNQRQNAVVPLFVACFIFVALTALQVIVGNEYSQPDVSGRGGHSWGSDDAFITYRYSHNLWHGYGWVFNPGEKPVEGCSTLLYALCMAPVAGLTNGLKVYFLSALFNLALSVAALVVFFRFVRSELGQSRATIAVFLGALCPALWVWAASGMETTLVFLLQICAWALVERVARQSDKQTESRQTHKKDLFLLCLVLGLTVLARADGFVFAALVALYLFLKGTHPRSVLITAATVVVVTGTNVIGRLLYYGYPLPNTYYAKVSGPLAERIATGLLQLSSLIGQAPALGVAIFAVAASFVLTSRRFSVRSTQAVQGISSRKNATPRFEMLFLPLWLLYWVYIGGDHFGDRFLLPLYFVGIFTTLRLLNFEPIGANEQSVQRPFRGAMVAVALLFAIVELGVVNHQPMFAYRRPKYDCWITLGRFLKQQYPDRGAGRKTTLAIDAAGKVPFITGFPTIDMLGLNDATLGHKPALTFRAGHNKYDPDYVLSKKPDLICAWISPHLDMGWGLTRAKYQSAGYRLRYLTNATLYSQAPSPDVRDVANISEPDIKELANQGFLYGVLERQEH